jgi:Co/Zn/Cd efflux system component
MEGAPSGVSADDVRRFIVGGFEHVHAVKDLRIWSITPEKVVLAVGVRTDGAVYPREKVRSMKALLKQRFGFWDVYVESYEDDLTA